MAVIENKVTEEGDVLVIKPEVPIVGLISLYNFVDTTDNESVTDFFKKEFRYSINGGITFSSWILLTIGNIQTLIISKENQFIIEYKYTRVGATPSVDLTFNNILVSGTTETLPYPVYNTTYFKDFFEVSSIEVFGWALNVLEKLYLTGILPEYMTRGEESSDILEDQDFLNFWHSITHYFAVIVYYARQYRDISSSSTLIELFLSNRDIEFGSATLEDAILLFNNYIEEFRSKGTFSIVNKKSDGYTTDGEFLRLIGFEDPEEFIFALLQNFETGWCIGKSSPVWNGSENTINTIKGYEYTKDVIDLDLYPLLNASNISIVGSNMEISNVSIGNKSGIYQDGDNTKRITVSPDLDYEISFFAKISNLNTPISFSLKGYDAEGGNVSFERVTNGDNSNDFFLKQVLKVSNEFYWIRGILYSQDKVNDVNSVFSPSGVNLRSKSTLKFIVPNILLDNETGSTGTNKLALWNIKVRPLKIPFTRGQLGIRNIILTYLTNRNSKYSIDKIESIMRNNLINANTFLKIKYISNE